MLATTVTPSQSIKEHYDKLFQDGFLINVHIRKWGMGSHLAKEDLGVTKDVPKIFKLGKKMLIKEERYLEFNRIESRARRFLYANAYDFPVGEAHFVPKKKVPDVLLKLNELKLEFFELRDKFIDKYEDYKEEVLKEYPDLAETLKPLYPAKATLTEKFGFGISMYELSMPKEFSEVKIQELLARDEAKADVAKKLQAQLAEQHANSVKQLEEFTETAAKALRTQIVDVCSLLMNKIKKKEAISKTNIISIKEEIQHFKIMNFLDDKIVADEIAKLEVLVNGNHDFKNDVETIYVLNQMLDEVVSKANNIIDIPTIRSKYFRAIKL